AEFGIVRVIRVLRLFLGIQVIEVAEKLVEASHRRQVLVHVAEVVLAELASGVAERLEQLRQRRVILMESPVLAGKADAEHPGPEGMLTSDERRAARRARLLTVGIG